MVSPRRFELCTARYFLIFLRIGLRVFIVYNLKISWSILESNPPSSPDFRLSAYWILLIFFVVKPTLFHSKTIFGSTNWRPKFLTIVLPREIRRSQGFVTWSIDVMDWVKPKRTVSRSTRAAIQKVHHWTGLRSSLHHCSGPFGSWSSNARFSRFSLSPQ